MSQPAISITGLSKRYHNGFEALQNIDLTVNKGDFYALLGPNGAGKSTTIGILTSLVNRSAGEVLIDGIDLARHPSLAKAKLGVVPQEYNINIFETCWQILTNQAAFYGVSKPVAQQRTIQLLKQLELWDKRNTIAGNLSGGMKRHLMIARALVHDPQILILDEPTAGVDVEIRQSMWRFLVERNKKGLTVVLTTHYLEEAESLCNRVVIIDHGKIVLETTMRDLLSQLEQEVLIFYLEKPMRCDPKIQGFSYSMIDDHTLEIEVKRGQVLNEIFAALNRCDIPVTSMRNKANRLEQLFMRLVNEKNTSEVV